MDIFALLRSGEAVRAPCMEHLPLSFSRQQRPGTANLGPALPLGVSHGRRSPTRAGFPRFIAAVGLFACALTMQSATATADDGGMSIAERVACRAAIENVRWSHVHWPESNPKPKPPRHVILTDIALRTDVEDGLRKETALRHRYNVVIDHSDLQVELNRVVANTKAPDRLQQMIAALGADPAQVAECIVRPLLVDRLIRHHVANDERIHGPARQAAKAAAAWPDRAWSATASGAIVSRTVFRTDRPETQQDPASHNSTRGVEVLVEPEELERIRESARIVRLPEGARVSGRAASLPVTETADAITAIELVRNEPALLEVRTLAWPKLQFDSWWLQNKAAFDPAASPIAQSIELPVVGAGTLRLGDLAADTWATQPGPVARGWHSAVWTGAEMIIFGGSGAGGLRLSSGSKYNPATDTWTPITQQGAPTGRMMHSAVWTGTEMVVWGGMTDSGRTATGGRYDPTTDSWGALDTQGAPAPREGHDAIWTGSEMLIWGGGVSTGARWSRATGRWSAISPTGAPSPRSGESATWTGTELVVWGGEDTTVSIRPSLANGARYSPATDRWVEIPTATAPAASAGHAAIWTGTEVVIWGGYQNEVWNQLSSGARYNPATDVWTPLPTGGAPIPRFNPSAIWTGNELLVWGGININQSGFWVYQNTGGRFNPSTNTWTAMDLAGAPSARHVHTMVWTGAELLVWGGFGGGLLQSGARYSTASNEWTAMSPAPPELRSNHSAIWTGQEMIVWGGTGPTGRLQSGARYDPALDRWIPTSTEGAPELTTGHVAVWTGAEMVVWAGQTLDPTAAVGGRYSPLSDSWRTMSRTGSPAEHVWLSSVWTGTELLVWGGYTQSAAQGNNTGALYNPASDAWRNITLLNAPVLRYAHSTVWTGREMIVWGGIDGNRLLGDGARYDPQADAWAGISGVGAPTPRAVHAAVWTGSEMLVWGGGAGGARYVPGSDTWAPMTTVNEPTPRDFPTAVWTGSDMVVWGGQTGPTASSSTNTGGRYSPLDDRWLATSVVGAPTARSRHTAVWTGREVIIHGGCCVPPFGLGFASDAGNYYPYGPEYWDLFGNGFEPQ